MEGPDLSRGVPLDTLEESTPLLGHVGEEAVLLVRRGGELFAVGATCTHYGAPLAEGMLDGESLLCPWHHACFSLRTGEALAAPALNPLPTWRVESEAGTVRVRERREAAPLATLGRTVEGPESVVIVGAGAAGSAAAEMLRREGYDRPVTMIDPDGDAPYDRPNLSKDYLAGRAPEEWLPLRQPGFYEENRIERVGAAATALDTGRRILTLSDGRTVPYGALLLATGAEPVRLRIPGADRPHVFVLRSLADCRRIIARAGAARRVVILGASFIGMEVAAALRARGLEVGVVAPDAVPFERVLGRELGSFLRRHHEEQGVRFHLGLTAAAIEEDRVELSDGRRLPAELVVVGVGVRPRVELAEAAGLAVDGGVVVDRYLRTAAPGVYAAGDIARWPDPYSGESVRVEHWAVAQQQGQSAARNILGRRDPFARVPFFWTQQYDLAIAYVGHAVDWDEVKVDGAIEARDCAVSYRRAGRTLALATIGRDRASLAAQVAMRAAG